MAATTIDVGDIFEIPAEDGQKGHGQIIVGGIVFYIVIFETLYDSRPELESILSDEILLVGWTTDALFYHKKWKVIGRSPIAKNVPRPYYKVGVNGKLFVTDFFGKPVRPATSCEIEFLDYRNSFSPLVFQKSLQSFHRQLTFPIPEKMRIEHVRARQLLNA